MYRGRCRDLVLGDGSKDLRDELAHRGIPYVIYSGMPKPPDVSVIFIEKPASKLFSSNGALKAVPAAA
jgi:hypothetical protein